MRTDGPVVIALDGSPASGAILEWGLAHARRHQARVVIARAYAPKPQQYTEWSCYPATADVGTEIAATEAYLTGQVAQARARYPELGIVGRVLHGPAVHELRTLSEEARVLVIGPGGGADPLHLSRSAARVAAHATCPVVVVQPGAAAATPAPVVVGVDGSVASLAAARIAADEAVAIGVPLVVVHARSLRPSGAGSGDADLSTATGDHDDPSHLAAQDVAADLRRRHPRLDIRLELLDDDPVHALTSTAHDAQLLVVGSRGLGACRRMRLGDVAKDVLRSSRVTVLVTHELEPV
jgi:nucleotide-binding universal stress UspA family protein